MLEALEELWRVQVLKSLDSGKLSPATRGRMARKSRDRVVASGEREFSGPQLMGRQRTAWR